MKKTLLFIILCLPISYSYVLANAVPIEITAGSLIIKDQENISTYTDNIVITQGELKITGSKAIIHHPNRQLSKAIITGSPATFINFIEEQNYWVEGHADKITYNTLNNTILFEGNAYIKQQNTNSISAKTIIYNYQKQIIEAKGDKASKQRIKVIFLPQDNNQE